MTKTEEKVWLNTFSVNWSKNTYSYAVKQLEIPNHIQMKISNPVNFSTIQIWSGDYSEPQAEQSDTAAKNWSGPSEINCNG